MNRFIKLITVILLYFITFSFRAVSSEQFREIKYTGPSVRFNGTNVVSGLIQQEIARVNRNEEKLSLNEINTRLVCCERMLEVVDTEWKKFVQEQFLLRSKLSQYMVSGTGFAIEDAELAEKLRDPHALFNNRYLGYSETAMLVELKRIDADIYNISCEMRRELIAKNGGEEKEKLMHLLEQLDQQWYVLCSSVLVDGKSIIQLLETDGSFWATSFRRDELDLRSSLRLEFALCELLRSDDEGKYQDATGRFGEIKDEIASIYTKWILADLPRYEDRLRTLHDACIKRAELSAVRFRLSERLMKRVREGGVKIQGVMIEEAGSGLKIQD